MLEPTLLNERTLGGRCHSEAVEDNGFLCQFRMLLETRGVTRASAAFVLVKAARSFRQPGGGLANGAMHEPTF
jgi:hypothetical protein